MADTEAPQVEVVVAPSAEPASSSAAAAAGIDPLTAAAEDGRPLGDPIFISYGDGDEVALDVVLSTTDRGIPLFPLEEDAAAAAADETTALSPKPVSSTAAATEEAEEGGSDEATESGLFGMLPDELLVRIHSYLDAPSLGRVAQTCKRFRNLSHDLPMWKEISKRENWSRGQPGLTRSFYVRKFLSFRRREREAQARRERQAQERRERRKKKRAVHGMLWAGFGRPYEWVCAICLLLFTIFCVCKWDHVIEWSWTSVFIPLYIVVAQVVLLPLLYSITSCIFDDDFDSEMEPDNACRPLMFNLFFIQPLIHRRFSRYLHFFSAIILLVWFLIMLIVKSCTDSSMTWTVAFIPLFIGSIYLSILPLSLGDTVFGDREWIDRVVLAPGGLFLFVFVLFLARQLDGVTFWSWQAVFSPLYALDGYFALLPFVLSIGNECCLEDVMYNHSRWSDEASTYCGISAAIIVIVIAPLLTFEILLAQFLDGFKDYRFAIIFIPIFIAEAIGLCACGILNLVIAFD